MATKLDKPVTREVADWSNGLCGKDSRRPLMVTINPAGFLTFRLKGTRQDYDLDFGVAYTAAVKRFAEKSRIEAKREKEARKAGIA